MVCGGGEERKVKLRKADNFTKIIHIFNHSFSQQKSEQKRGENSLFLGYNSKKPSSGQTFFLLIFQK